MRAQRKEPEEPLVLEVTAGPLKGQMFNKRMQRVTVGRTKKSHVALKDSAVSQKHAEFRYDGAWCITDSGSSNGTFLNGQALNEEGVAVSKALRTVSGSFVCSFSTV